MEKMLAEMFVLLCLGYVSFGYIQLTENILGQWTHFILLSFVTFSEVAVIHIRLYKRFPKIIFDCKDYIPNLQSFLMKCLFIVLFYVSSLVLIYLLFVFLYNAENMIGIFVLQLISFVIISMSVLQFLIEGFSDYSGNAYCDYLMRGNNRKIEYCYIPQSLTADIMIIYKQEKKLE